MSYDLLRTAFEAFPDIVCIYLQQKTETKGAQLETGPATDLFKTFQDAPVAVDSHLAEVLLLPEIQDAIGVMREALNSLHLHLLLLPWVEEPKWVVHAQW